MRKEFCAEHSARLLEEPKLGRGKERLISLGLPVQSKNEIPRPPNGKAKNVRPKRAVYQNYADTFLIAHKISITTLVHQNSQRAFILPSSFRSYSSAFTEMIHRQAYFFIMTMHFPTRQFR
jgi:hypothetical protein